MSHALVVDLARNAIMLALLVAGPMLVVALLVGLTVSVLQAVTQIQEQTLAFVPKLVGVSAVFLLALPWILQLLVKYTTELFRIRHVHRSIVDGAGPLRPPMSPRVPLRTAGADASDSALRPVMLTSCCVARVGARHDRADVHDEGGAGRGEDGASSCCSRACCMPLAVAADDGVIPQITPETFIGRDAGRFRDSGSAPRCSSARRVSPVS